MISEVPLVGNMNTGFGQNSIIAPTAKTPNLEEASEKFVSMLYSYMFQQMRESGADEEEGLFSGPHVNMLMGFLDQEIGEKLAASEGKGLADALMRQMDKTGGREAPMGELADASANPLSAADGANSDSLTVLTQAGNTIQEMTQKQPDVVDNSQQIMDQIYKINQR